MRKNKNYFPTKQKIKRVTTKMATLALLTGMLGSSVMPVMSAYALNTPSAATTNDLNNHDIIKRDEKATLDIYKYDITRAEAEKAYTSDTTSKDYIEANGEANATLQEKLKKYTIEGVEFTYLRVGNVETYSEFKDGKQVVNLVYEIDDDLAEILGLTAQQVVDMKNNVSQPCDNEIKHYRGQDIINGLKTALEDNMETKNKLEAYITAHNGTIMPLTDKNGHTSAKDLDLGLYLLVETKVPEEVTTTVNPWFAQLPFTNDQGEEWLYNMTCYPKNQTGNPTFDKSVRNAHGTPASTVGQYEDFSKVVTNLQEDNQKYVDSRKEFTYANTVTASEGDLLDYILVSKLPHVQSKASYLKTFSFKDVLSQGLTYNQDIKIAIYNNEEDAKVNNTANAVEIWDNAQDLDGNYLFTVKEETVNNKKTNNTQLDISMTDAGLKKINETYHDYYMVAYYTVNVNSDATAVLGDEGNPNDAKLTWERTSKGYYDTLEDRNYVYTYGLDLTKKFSDGKGDATKVKFALHNTTDGYYVVADNVTTNADGKKVYYVTGKTPDQDKATIFSPDKDGAMLIYGLEADKYQLTETHTDNGYSLLKDQIEIDISSTEREINQAVCGNVGFVESETHKHTDACYATNDEGNKVLICGHTDTSGTNGRTVGKTDMVVGDIKPATATVDDLAVDLLDYVTTQNANSADAIAQMEITNTKSFELPVTGGSGLYLVTVMGVLAVAGGCYTISKTRKKKENQ